MELNSNTERFPGSFPDFPGSSPNFPGSFPDFPGGQPLSLGSLTPSPDSQKLFLKAPFSRGGGPTKLTNGPPTTLEMSGMAASAAQPFFKEFLPLSCVLILSKLHRCTTRPKGFVFSRKRSFEGRGRWGEKNKKEKVTPKALS